MPSYEYRCSRCGHEFELIQKMADPPRKRCPKCRSKVERKIGAGAGLLFKGSGFHITDYRSADYKAKAKADTADTAGGSKSGSSSTAGTPGKDPGSAKEGGTKGNGTKPASEK